ncbi:putative RAB6-interacting golgin [Arabidopsis thaliana]
MRMKATRLPMKTYISVLSNTNIVSKGLEIMGDPMRKEVGMVRKKIEMANREIKSLSQSCQKKVSYNQSLLTILLLTSTTLLYPSILTPDDK